jgi:pyruvate dehydrogenase E2 component (dihydrolipoamide acetyltransferase)
MTSQLKLPELGENIDAAEVIAVLVAVGDTLVVDQPVIELETDKATAEVPASFAGVVRKIHVKPGDQVSVGQVIADIDQTAVQDKATGPSTPAISDSPEPAPSSSASQAPAPAAQPAPVVPPTKPIRDGTPAAAVLAADASADSTLSAAPATVDEDMLAGARENATAGSPAAPSGAPAAASPSVRRLARELGLDITQVPGSGSNGRISEEDVKTHTRARLGGASPAPTTAVSTSGATQELPDFTRWGQVEREPLNGVRRATAANMARAWNLIPHVTQFDRADVTALEAFRSRYRGQVEKAGGKLTVTAVLVKLAAAALGAFPRFNSSFDAARGELVLKRYVNIGVAVDTERGLLVPVIRDAGSKSLVEIGKELDDLATRARNRKLGMDELTGGTFTISNLGGLGTTYFSPIVNWPEVAILGVGRSRREAVEVEGQLVARSILPLSISYDHRVIDGADAARYLRWLSEAIENPLLLVLDR